MVKPIVKDTFFLGQKSEDASEQDAEIIENLRDTLNAHRDTCVGMAANMIGYRKRIIIVSLGFANLVMVNPIIVKKSQPYETEEGCLSLEGMRKTRRYRKITVHFLDESFHEQTQDFEGHIAQVIQHECDHLEGIII